MDLYMISTYPPILGFIMMGFDVIEVDVPSCSKKKDRKSGVRIETFFRGYFRGIL